jgi:transcription initiation factor IIE alpha subunit
MAYINPKILNAAYKDGLFRSRPTATQKDYLKPSILTVWRILDIVEKRDETGIDGESIAKKLDINYNTVKIYLRWMRSKKLIICEVQNTSGGPYIFYPKDT